MIYDFKWHVIRSGNTTSYDTLFGIENFVTLIIIYIMPWISPFNSIYKESDILKNFSKLTNESILYIIKNF